LIQYQSLVAYTRCTCSGCSLYCVTSWSSDFTRFYLFYYVLLRLSFQ